MPFVPNPWIILGLVAFYLASLAGVGAWQRHDGGLSEKNKCVSSQNEALQTSQKNEARLQAELAQAGVDHAEEIKKGEDQKDADVRDAYNRGLRLRTRGSCVAAPQSSSAASPSVSDGGAICELSPKTTADLFGLADDADSITKQLTAAQQVIRALQKSCHP